MFRIVSIFALLFAMTSARADDAVKAAAAKRVAEELSEAMMARHYDKVVDRTFDKLVAAAGGREKIIKIIQSGIQRGENEGMKIISLKVGEPGELHHEGENSFLVVPTTTQVRFPKATGVLNGYMLGISKDSGKTWKFLEGNNLESETARTLFLPKLPATLKLPKKAEPIITND